MSIKADIIAKAKTGMRPIDIEREYGGRIEYGFITNTIYAARQAGEDIPVFGNNGGRQRKPVEQPAAFLPPATMHVPPNHSELMALKKMLGPDLAEIEAAADAETKSLAVYVREVLLEHVRKLKA